MAMSKENFSNSVKYKTLILDYMLKNGSMTIDQFRELYPELPHRAGVRYFDRLFNTGHIVECSQYGHTPLVYCLAKNRIDVCQAIVDYNRKLGIIS